MDDWAVETFLGAPALPPYEPRELRPPPPEESCPGAGAPPPYDLLAPLLDAGAPPPYDPRGGRPDPLAPLLDAGAPPPYEPRPIRRVCDERGGIYATPFWEGRDVTRGGPIPGHHQYELESCGVLRPRLPAPRRGRPIRRPNYERGPNHAIPYSEEGHDVARGGPIPVPYEAAAALGCHHQFDLEAFELEAFELEAFGLEAFELESCGVLRPRLSAPRELRPIRRLRDSANDFFSSEDHVISCSNPIPDPHAAAAALGRHRQMVLESGALRPQLQPDE